MAGYTIEGCPERGPSRHLDPTRLSLTSTPMVLLTAPTHSSPDRPTAHQTDPQLIRPTHR
eukprot:2305921-Prymnesium_polylepis.1